LRAIDLAHAAGTEPIADPKCAKLLTREHARLSPIRLQGVPSINVLSALTDLKCEERLHLVAQVGILARAPRTAERSGRLSADHRLEDL
jgi:hypothetical protein